MSEQPTQENGGKTPKWKATSLLTRSAPNEAIQLHSGLAARKDALQRVLGRTLNADRFIEVVMMVVQGNPAIAKCVPESILREVWRCATYGLLPDGVQAAMVPYKVRGVPTCQLQVMYRGYMDLAYRHPKIVQIDPPVIVYEGDKFDYALGTAPFITHVQCDDPDARGEWTHVYSVAELAGSSRPNIRVLSRKQVETEHRAKSRSWQRAEKDNTHDSTWHLYEEAMVLKTALRVHCKYLPASLQLQQATAQEEKIDAGIDVAVDGPRPITASVIQPAAANEEEDTP